MTSSTSGPSGPPIGFRAGISVAARMRPTCTATETTQHPTTTLVWRDMGCMVIAEDAQGSFAPAATFIKDAVIVERFAHGDA